MVSVVMTVPNSLTIARIFFVPLLAAVLVDESVAVRLGGGVITNASRAPAVCLAPAGTCLLDCFAAAEGYTIKASELGKARMFAQVVAFSFLLLSIRHPNLAPLANWMMWGVVVFSVASAVDYFRKFWRKVDVRVKKRRRRELLRMERRARRQKLAALAQSGSREGFRGTI